MKVLMLISDLNCQTFAAAGGKSGTYYTRVSFENSVFIFGKWHLLHQLRSRFLILFLESGTYYTRVTFEISDLILDSGTYYTIILHNYQREMPLKTLKISLCLLKLPKFFPPAAGKVPPNTPPFCPSGTYYIRTPPPPP